MSEQSKGKRPTHRLVAFIEQGDKKTNVEMAVGWQNDKGFITGEIRQLPLNGGNPIQFGLFPIKATNEEDG